MTLRLSEAPETAERATTARPAVVPALQGEIKPLTSIRGVAACMVAAYHFFQNETFPAQWLANLVRKGYFWVDLFFVLSGFVMAMTYGAMFVRGYRWSAHREFLGRRIARIYPLYLAVTLAVSAYTLAVYHHFHNTHRPAVDLPHPLLAHITNALMIQAWGFGTSIGGPTWSISTEWAAYLIFPLLVSLALYRGWVATALLGAAAAALLYWVGTHAETGQTVRNGQLDIFHCRDTMAVMRCVGGFALGLVAFRAQAIGPLARLLGRDEVCLALFLALLAAMAAKLPDLWIYPLLPLLVISLAQVRGWAARLFSAEPLYHLGLWSYAIYLVHQHFDVLLQQLDRHLSHVLPAALAQWAGAAITISLVLGTAVVSYRLIEKPWRGRLRHLFE